jgi:hypothetical protein
MSKANQVAATGGGIGFTSAIGIVFIILKLTGNISWSWWLVLLPFYWWIPVGVAVIFTILILMFLAGELP